MGDATATIPTGAPDGRHPGGMTEPAEPGLLTERDRAILDFERTWWQLDVPREEAIRERFGCTADDYDADLHRVLELPEAMDHDPLVVRRFQRRRLRRRRELLAPARQ